MENKIITKNEILEVVKTISKKETKVKYLYNLFQNNQDKKDLLEVICGEIKKLEGFLKPELLQEFYSKTGRNLEAARLYEKSAEEDFAKCYDYVTYHSYLKRAGENYEKVGKLEDAVRCYSKGGDYEKAVNYYFNHKNLEGLARTYEKAGDIGRKANLYAAAGENYEKVGKLEDAARAYEKAGDGKYYYLDYGTLFEPKSYMNKEEYDQKARELYKKTKNKEKEINLCLKLGNTYFESGRRYHNKKSIGLAGYWKEQAGDLLKDEELYRQSTKDYIEAEKYEEASRVYKKVKEENRSEDIIKILGIRDKRFAEEAGQLYLDSSQYKEAAKCFERARRLDLPVNFYDLAGDREKYQEIKQYLSTNSNKEFVSIVDKIREAREKQERMTSHGGYRYRVENDPEDVQSP